MPRPCRHISRTKLHDRPFTSYRAEFRNELCPNSTSTTGITSIAKVAYGQTDRIKFWFEQIN